MDNIDLMLLVCCWGLGIESKRDLIDVMNKFTQDNPEYESISNNILGSIDKFNFLKD